MRQVRVVYLAHRAVPWMGRPRVRVRRVRWGWAWASERVKSEGRRRSKDDAHNTDAVVADVDDGELGFLGLVWGLGWRLCGQQADIEARTGIHLGHGGGRRQEWVWLEQTRFRFG